MVARHTKRTGWHSADGCSCIDCGTRYLFTNTYKGNYCPDCHDQWVERQRDETPAHRPPRLRSTTRQSPDDTVDTDRSYDEE